MDMKKKIAISFIFMIFFLFVSMRLWLSQEPMEIDLSLKNSKNTEFEFFISTKDDYEKFIPDGDKNYLRAFLKHTDSKDLKNFSLIITTNCPHIKADRVVIDKIRFSSGKDEVVITDFGKFSSKDAKMERGEDFVSLIPENQYFTLSYSGEVDIKSPSIKINFPVFFLIALGAFGVFFFKIAGCFGKECRYSDMFVVVIFFSLLFFPMLCISEEERSVVENRALAKYKPLFSGGKINFDYGRNFDEFYGDRFFLREMVVRVYMDLRYHLAKDYYSTKMGFLNKQNGWMHSHLHQSKSGAYLSEEKLDKYEYSIRKLREFCKNNGIKLYILLPPDKSAVYHREMYPFVGKTFEVERSEIMQSYLRDKLGVKIIYPYDDMIEASKKEYMFYKGDHHWSEDAAFVSYKKLMKEIKKDFPDIPVVSEGDYFTFRSNRIRSEFPRVFHNGRSYISYLNLNDLSLLNVWYRYYLHKDADNLKTVVFDDYKKYPHKFYKYEKGRYRGILMGDSFGDNMTEFFPYSFKESERIYTYSPFLKDEEQFSMKRFEEDIIKFKPDILVLCLSYSGLYKLDTLYIREDR